MAVRRGNARGWSAALLPLLVAGLVAPLAAAPTAHALASEPHVGCSWLGAAQASRTCTGTEFTDVGTTMRTTCLKRKPPKKSVVQRFVRGRWVGQYSNTWFTTTKSTSCPRKQPWLTTVVLELDADEAGQTRYYRLYMPLSKKKVAVWNVQACAVPSGSDLTCS